MRTDARRAYERKWYSDHRESRLARYRSWAKNNPELHRTINRDSLWKGRGVLYNGRPFTDKDRRVEYDKQNGLCAFCGEPLVGSAWAADHDHETKQFRGLVHRRCNIALIGANTLKTAERLVVYLNPGSYTTRP
jgi:hypothetical protein